MNTKALLKQLTEHEGRVLHAYQDHLGYWTLGVGRLIDARRGGGITEEEADFLLQNDLKKVFEGLDKELPWWRNLDEIRQRVLIDMAFNLGVIGLTRFHTTLKHVKNGNYDFAATNMLRSLWARQVGRRARRLAKMMAEGREVSLDEA